MNQALTRQLFARYPRVFGYRTLGPGQSCMCFGFECGDGWFTIIDAVSWWYAAMWKLLRVDVRATQVKEKFGGLRYYTIVYTPAWMRRKLSRWAARFAWWLEARAERASYRTCEVCGAPGRPNSRGWISTLCDGCRR